MSKNVTRLENYKKKKDGHPGKINWNYSFEGHVGDIC